MEEKDRKVVITGMGIWSCLGTSLKEVRQSLYDGKSGIVFAPERKEMGFQSGLTAHVPMPELKAEEAPPARADEFASAVESEAALAEKLGENDLAGRIRALQPGEQGLVSALYLMEKDSSEACEAALARLSDEYGEPPVPVDAFAPLLLAAPRLPAKLMALRGVVAFARIGDVALVAHLSPNDSLLHRAVTAALGLKARFFLAEPSKIEKAVETLVAAESGEGGKEGA